MQTPFINPLRSLDITPLLTVQGITISIQLPYLYWKFDEAAAPWVDSVHSQSLTVSGHSPTIVSALINNGLNSSTTASLTGVHNSSVAMSFDPTLGMSMSFWINRTTHEVLPTIDQTIFSMLWGTSNFTLTLRHAFAQAALTISSINQGTVTSGTLSDGSWHFAVFTFNPALLMTLYLDGASVGTTTASGTPASASTVNCLIQTQCNGSSPDNITWDEVGVWPRPISASEVTQMWNGGAGARPPGV